MVITSKNNPEIKRINSLKDKKYRKEFGEFIIEGVKQIKECENSQYIIKTIARAESYSGATFGYNEIICSDDVFKFISDEITPQGILAVVKIPTNNIKEPLNNCLLLDGVSDPGNFGTIIRTANACGITQIYAVNCVDPYSPKCIRSCMSGIFFVEIFILDKESALNMLKNTPIVCADMLGESMYDFVPPTNFCLCLGNEANGVSSEVKSKAKYTVKIPMRKTAESLNVAVAGGILMYNLLKNTER